LSWSNDKAPAELAAGVNWWLDSSEDRSEGVVMVAEDGMDALILSAEDDEVAWVDYGGEVRVMKGGWKVARRAGGNPVRRKIVVEVTVDDTDERATQTATEFAGHIRDLAKNAFMRGGTDLMGYEGALLKTVETKVEEIK
jgi:hypothetical protein